MDYSKNGLELTKQFESCRLMPYQDIRGIWTVGYGHTGSDVVPGVAITQAQADYFLSADIQKCVRIVNTLVTAELTQGQFDALVDFAFNCGIHALSGSTLLVKLNAGDYHGAAAEFERWDHAAGKVVAGLLRRRQAEEQEFNG